MVVDMPMRNRKCRPLMFRIALMTIILASTLPKQALAQERGEAQANYLRAVGLDQDGRELEQALLERLQFRVPLMLAARQQGLARFFAFVLTVSGLNAEKVEHLEAEGIDLIHAITADTRPLSEQALLADLVIVGDVTGITETLEPDDGFRSSIAVEVQTLLKGVAPSKTIFIRQRSRLSREGTPERTSRDLHPEVGERYLFLLSNGMYRFFVASRDEEPLPEAMQAQYFVIYRSYRMEEGQLLWNGFSRRDTEQAFEELRKLDQLLAEF